MAMWRPISKVAMFLFTAAKSDVNSTALADDLEIEIEIAIADRLAVRPAVVVLARRELTHVVRDNPFRDEDDHRLSTPCSSEKLPGRTAWRQSRP
jgi:hypothetical protein